MLPLIMAGAGLGKSLLIDGPKAERDRQLQATTAALSPWTGMQPSAVAEPDAFGSALQGGMAGAAFEQANPDMFKAAAAPGAEALSPETVAGRAAEASYQFPQAAPSAPAAMTPPTFMSGKKKSPYDLMANQRMG